MHNALFAKPAVAKIEMNMFSQGWFCVLFAKPYKSGLNLCTNIFLQGDL